MIVTANTLRFDSLSLDSGATLSPVGVTYESYGELNAAKSNALLVLHAFFVLRHPVAGGSDLRILWRTERRQVQRHSGAACLFRRRPRGRNQPRNRSAGMVG